MFDFVLPEPLSVTRDREPAEVVGHAMEGETFIAMNMARLKDRLSLKKAKALIKLENVHASMAVMS